MNTILIPTTQNIELEYPVAELGDRLLAGMIDLAVLVLYVWFWLTWLDDYQSYSDFWGYATDVIYQLALLPAMTYSLWTELWFNGQTLGKKLLKLRTIRLDGASPGLSEYAIRWLLRIADIWATSIIMVPGLVAMVAMGVGKKGQRLGDMAAGTSVVKLKLVTTFADTIFVETRQDYSVQFPAVSKLSDRDISILKEVMDAGKKNDNAELLGKLATRVSSVMEVETQLPPAEFLTTVLKDYNFLYRD